MPEKTIDLVSGCASMSVMKESTTGTQKPYQPSAARRRLQSQLRAYVVSAAVREQEAWDVQFYALNVEHSIRPIGTYVAERAK